MNSSAIKVMYAVLTVSSRVLRGLVVPNTTGLVVTEALLGVLVL